MLDKFRETAITWDKATRRIYSPVTANESDENGRKLVVQIVNSGQVEDLTGAALHLYWETRDKAHDGLDVFKAVDLKKGEFELSYTTGMLSNHGVLNANLVLIDTIGRVVSERFKITVTEGIDDDAIQSENSFSSLTQALLDISNLEQNYAPRLNDLTAQLQQTGAASANGLTKKELDQTTDLNALFNTVSSANLRYATFDGADEYTADGNLTDAYKVIKRGNGKIKSSNPNNVYVKIARSLSSFDGKINAMGCQKNADVFGKTIRALYEDRPVKVAVIGDSIWAGSPDTTEFSTRVTKKNGHRVSTDAIVTDNSPIYRVMNKLSEQFPSKNFILNNYAVGGTRIDLWDQTVNYWGQSKKWIDWLKEANPDLVFIAFGMNNNEFGTAKTFAYDLKSMMEYIKSNFSSGPDIVVVTTPRPVYIPGHADWGNFENQGGRMVAQNAARAIAKEYGAYVMDAGRISDIKRIGLDYTKPIMRRMELKDFTITTTNATRNADDSFNFGATGAGTINLKGNYQKDFTVKMNISFTTPTPTAFNQLVFCFNKTRDADFYENRINIIPRNGLNLANIKAMTRIADYTSWGNNGVTSDFTDDVLYDGTSVTIIVSKRADNLEVRIVKSGAEYVVIQDTVDVLDVHGFFQVRYEPSGSGNSAKLNSIEINGAEYPDYLPKITENEMFGGFVNGDYTLKLPFGGNGVNHPSSIGVEEIYKPCADELVGDIVSRMGSYTNYLYPVIETKDSLLATSSISYIMVDTKILRARLVKSDGTIFKHNKKITGWNGVTIGGTLGVGEFGMFMETATQAMIIINSPASSGWTVTTYQV